MAKEFVKLYGCVVHIESAIAKLQSLVKPPAQPIMIVLIAAAAAVTTNPSSPLSSSK